MKGEVKRDEMKLGIVEHIAERAVGMWVDPGGLGSRLSNYWIC